MNNKKNSYKFNNSMTDRDEELETEAERRQRRKSHIVVYVTTFVMSIGFSIVLTGVWPYLKRLDSSASKEFLGWVVAANPLGQMLAAPLLGWCANKVGSNRGAFLGTITSFIFGNVMYAILPLFKTNVKYLMMVSRFVVGVSSANIAASRSYISSSTKIKERTSAMAIIAASQSMGIILGPSIQTLMAYCYQKESGNTTLSNGTMISTDEEEPLLMLNMYTLAAWFVAFLGVLNLFLFLPCVYKESNISLREAKRSLQNGDVKKLKPDYIAVSAILLTFFSMLFVHGLLETIVVPMCLDMYGWEPEFAVKVVGIGLTVSGTLALAMFIISGKLANVFTDRIIYIGMGLIPLTLGMLIYIPFGTELPPIKQCEILQESMYNETLIASYHCPTDQTGCPSIQTWCFDTPIIPIPQFGIACLVTTLSYPVALSLSNGIYSKLIGPKAQGLWMGLFTSVGSLSMVMGPIYTSYIYTLKGPIWTFGSIFSLFFLILIFNFCVCKRYTPLAHRQQAVFVPDDTELEFLKTTK